MSIITPCLPDVYARVEVILHMIKGATQTHSAAVLAQNLVKARNGANEPTWRVLRRQELAGNMCVCVTMLYERRLSISCVKLRVD